MGHHHSSPKPTVVVNNGTVFNPHATNNAVVNANNIGLQNLYSLQLQQLNWWDDIKADAHQAAAHAKADFHKVAADTDADFHKAAAAAKADFHKAGAAAAHAGHVIDHDAHVIGHDLSVAGQLCGQNKMCIDIAQRGTEMAEHEEFKMVNNWINHGQKATWCKNNTTCVAIVKKVLATAESKESEAINNWLHPQSLQQLGWWNDIKADASKAEHAVVHAADAIGHDLSVAGKKCGQNKICSDIAKDGTQMAENAQATMVKKWIKNGQKATWCKKTPICVAVVKKVLAASTTEETKAINKWLANPNLVLIVL